MSVGQAQTGPQAGPRHHHPQAIAETRQRVMRIFQRLWGPDGENPSWGIQIEELLGMATATFVENPGMTLAEVPELFENATFRAAMLANVTNPDVRRFWLGRYEAMSAREQRSYTDSTRRRVQEFLIDPIVKHIVAQPHTTFDVPGILARGQLLFVALNPLLKELTALVGATILELIGDAAFNRPAGQRRPYFVYADECQRFSTTNLHELIPQIRKFGVAISLAHQFRGQFPRSHPMHEASTAMGSFVILRTKAEDARELAEHFDTTPDQPRQVPLDPLGELERRGHPNDAVVRTLRELRGLLASERGDIERRVAYDREAYRDARRYGSPSAVELPISATTELGQLREAVNDYLARTLEGQQPDIVPLSNGRLCAVIERLGDLVAEAPESLFVHAADQRGSRGEKRAQVENALKHLPRYRAYGKVLRTMGDNEVTVEHVLETAHFHPVDERPAAVARVVALRSCSAMRYGTPVAQIEAAMAARQASSDAGGSAGAAMPARPRGPRPEAPTARRAMAPPEPPHRRNALVQAAVVTDDEEWG